MDKKRLFTSLIVLGLAIAQTIAQDDFMMGPPPPGGTPPQKGDGRGLGMPPVGPDGISGPGGGGQKYVEAKGVKTFNKNKTINGKDIESTTTDKSAVLCTGGTLDISYSSLSNKADATSTDDASFYGVNAVLLAQPKDRKEGSAVINSSHNTIKGSGRGANGIFAYGNGVVNTSYDNIYQTGGNARGMLCSGGGTINVVADTVVTMAGSASCIATDRGGGTINIDGGLYTCNGANSAGLYSTGIINAKNATFISNGGEMIVIEGTNYINTENCHFTSKKDKWGVLLYQSFSGDADEGDEATLSMKGGSLTYEGKKTGMFYNTNNRDSLYLNNVELINNSDTLINCKKGGWGNRDTARRGGTLGVRCDNQIMKGIVYADKNSSIKLTLAEGTQYTGAFNPDNTAKYARLSIDGSSRMALTADSYVNGELVLGYVPSTDKEISNIASNGHNLYYSMAKNKYLEGKSYLLNGGGKLLPLE